MKIQFGMPACAVGLVLASAVGMTTISSAAEQLSKPRLKHAPIQLHRNPDGSPQRGLRNQFISTNWSGYVVANYQTGVKYNSASMTWVVPTVSYGQSTDTTSSTQYSANWVGIGGFCANQLCTRGDHTLIQLGTEQDVSPSGITNYYAWYEVLPQPETPLDPTSHPVHPGDLMTASLSCQPPCSGKKQNWTLSMTDETQKWTWSMKLSYGSSLLSAEWIEEAPYSGGILPLANFGTAKFPGPDLANNTSPTVSSANIIQMQDPWGQWANPSAATAPDFNACWGFGVFTPC
jgi:Peptidase A4 family